MKTGKTTEPGPWSLGRRIQIDWSRNSLKLGMTLTEVLVAVLVFVFLVGALVSLARAGLDTWSEGETRKDMYDRAQVILQMVQEDLRNTLAENEWIPEGQTAVKQPPAFLSDFDRNNRAWLRFVRTGHPHEMRVGPERKIRDIVPATYYTDAWEVSYLMDSKADAHILYRGVRFFDRRRKGSFFDDDAIPRTSGPRFQKWFTPIDDGVLYLGFKYWTQYTTTWDSDKRIRRQRSRRGAQDSGPSYLWDSTRREIREFALHRRRQFLDDPDFVYPEIVQVSLTLESTAGEVLGAELGEDVSESARKITVVSTLGMPDAPDFVKIEGEWIEYKDLTASEIIVRSRGVRGTKGKAHKSGARVHFGKTFTMDVPIPVFREAVNP